MTREDDDANARSGPRRGAPRHQVATVAAFAVYSLRRFNADGCFAASGALSYTTLVSLVPLAAIALGSLSAFPIFAQVHNQILALVFRNFVPSIGEQAAYWFSTFTNSAGQATAIGVIGIAATGILLLVTVEDQLNLIWRVTSARPWGQRVLAYWTLITLGPLLVGISLSLSTYFEIAASRAGFGQQAAQWIASGWLHGLARTVPALLEFLALNLLYWLIPNCAVRWRDGAVGALIATIAIEILKVGFTAYVGAMSYYQTVYGALAAIPIFLLWMYISWMAVLLGAVAAAALPHWRIDERLAKVSPGGIHLGLSLALIAALARAQQHGRTITTVALASELGVATTVIDEHVKPLVAAGFVAHTQGGSWVLAWSPEAATLRDLYEALHLPFAGAWIGQTGIGQTGIGQGAVGQGAVGQAPWQRQVAPALERIAEAESAVMQISVAELIGETAAPAAAMRRARRHVATVPEKLGSR